VPLDGSRTYGRRARTGDYEVAIAGWLADYPDDQEWLDNFTPDSLPFRYRPSPQFLQLVNEADQMTNASQRQKLYDRAQAMLIKEYLVAFLFSQQRWNLIKPYVRGLTGTAMDENAVPGTFFISRAYITQH
jgi:oligopeptide transport system substrate-binding protein